MNAFEMYFADQGRFGGYKGRSNDDIKGNEMHEYSVWIDPVTREYGRGLVLHDVCTTTYALITSVN